uniref:Cyclic nucleotide-binding domain-containing protein n=1 Tax=Anopheles atroparvus TaxID=41427 RepID=A0A182IQE8_ANOAO
MFGEIALLHDCPRTATCTTATDCELLCVARTDFDRILRRTLLDRWAQIQRALERFDYFKHWSSDQVRECCILSGIVEYEPQQKLPVSEGGTERDCAHFVLSGQCMILQCLTVSKVKGNFQLLPILSDENKPGKVEAGGTNERPTDHSAVVEHRFIDVGTFSCGAAFGLGETMQHRMVVARTRVQCLAIPRDWLFERRQNVGNTWQRVRMQLDMTVPSRGRLFEMFVREHRWRRYRKALVQEFVRRNPRKNPTRLADVPIMCRMEQGDSE